MLQHAAEVLAWLELCEGDRHKEMDNKRRNFRDE